MDLCVLTFKRSVDKLKIFLFLLPHDNQYELFLTHVFIIVDSQHLFPENKMPF